MFVMSYTFWRVYTCICKQIFSHIKHIIFVLPLSNQTSTNLIRIYENKFSILVKNFHIFSININITFNNQSIAPYKSCFDILGILNNTYLK